MPLWLTWLASTAVGVSLGAGISGEWSLDFATPLVFIVLPMPALRGRAHVVAAVVGGVVATLGAALPLQLRIIAGAIGGIVAGYLAERRLSASR